MNFARVLILAALVASQAPAASLGGVLHRAFTGLTGQRVSYLAPCLGNLFDYSTTEQILAIGGVEQNPLFAPHGVFIQRRFRGFKIGGCVLPVIVGETLHAFHHDEYQRTTIVSDWVAGAVFGGISGWNRQQYRKQVLFNLQ